MMQSMKGATRIIGGMNRSMNLPALSKIAQDFERENDIMEQRQEMMEDAVDDALGDPAEEEESEETIAQILDELGIEFNAKVSTKLLSLTLLIPQSSGKLLVAFKLLKCQRAEWHRQLVVEKTISRQDLQV